MEQQTRQRRFPLGSLNDLKILVSHAGDTRTVGISDMACSIGSGRQCAVRIPDPYVSRHHCSVFRRRDRVGLRDERSRNGTWVNGIRVDRCDLSPGAEIKIGDAVLTLQHCDRDTESRWGIVGQHQLSLRMRSEIERYAPTPYPVLILGETGTGKELVARAVHRASPRAQGPFEVVNCAAIPRELAESELFGHERGAFTGAERSFAGAFVRANGGTLFLDEIGEMPPELQPKLLRVLEQRTVRPVGSTRQREIDVRVVAATHRDLEQETELGRFRLDLLHRLAVAVVRVPPLRERASDVPLLVEHFLREGPVAVGAVDDAAMAFLRDHSWPGNVRALLNALRRAAAGRCGVLALADFDFLRGQLLPRLRSDCVSIVDRSFGDIRREVYLRTLERHEGNRSAAAAALGVAKSTFFDHLRQHQLNDAPE